MATKKIRASSKKDDAKQIIAFSAPVEIKAADEPAEGESKGPPTFNVVAYNGGAMTIEWWDAPVVVDLSGMTFRKNLVANLDHDRSKRVGHVTAKDKSDGQLTLSGVASAATPHKTEVVDSAASGFNWEASIEATPLKVVELDDGDSSEVNGQVVEGPAYVIKKSVLSGFAFVSHGADDSTKVKIAATIKSKKDKTMDPKLKAWIESLGFDVDELSAGQVANLTADYEGRDGKRTTPKIDASNPFEARKMEVKRKAAIRDISDKFIEHRGSNLDEIEAIEKMHDHAIETGMSVQDFRIEMYESSVPVSNPIIHSPRDNRVSARIMEAAVCQTGRLPNIEKHFTDQELQAAHTAYKRGIGLNQLILNCATANGYRSNNSTDITVEAQRFAFGMGGQPRQVQGAFSTLAIPDILSNTANKFLMQGWNAVDMTPLRISKIRSVRNFQTITTVSLTGDLDFEKVGATGEIKHGNLGEETYTNKADTYARMLAVTRTDMINDDLGALTDVPMKLGRGSANKLNDIFWTAFLNNSAFFTSGRNNVNTGVADMTSGGLAATETIFLNQTDPDRKPLGIEPQIVLVPVALRSAAHTLRDSEKLIDGTATGTQGDANIFKDRFTVESSQYMANSVYTGYSAAAWYMLADPNVLPVIEIVALNGRVEPVVETADAAFNVLGIEMRGYSDVGVSKQEYRAGVRADGGAS